MPWPYDEASRRTPAKKRLGVLRRARAQIWIAARLTALGHFKEALLMVDHAIDSIDDFVKRTKGL